MRVENTYVDGYNKLPDKAYVAVKRGEKIILITRGKKRYKEIKTRKSVDELNQKLAVTKAEAKAMWHGCCGQGWHYNFNADPDYYDEGGEVNVPKVKKLMRHNIRTYRLASMIFDLINQYNFYLFINLGIKVTDGVEGAITKICKYLNNENSILLEQLDKIRLQGERRAIEDLRAIQEMIDSYYMAEYR